MRDEGWLIITLCAPVGPIAYVLFRWGWQPLVLPITLPVYNLVRFLWRGH